MVVGLQTITWKYNNQADGDDRGPLREFEPPLEVSHGIFLVNPPSHRTSRKVEGLLLGSFRFEKHKSKKEEATPANIYFL